MHSFISKLEVTGPKNFAGYDWQECRALFDPELFQASELENFTHELPPNFETFHKHKKAEFVASRMAIKELFSKLNISDPLPQRITAQSPVWPASYLGSISHTKGVAVVAMASSSNLKGLGLDCERLERCQQVENIWTKISTHEEREFFHKNRWRDAYWKLILFSAKESLYKAAYPLVQQYFGFEQAQVIALNPQSQELVLRSDFLTAKIPGTTIHARYDLEGDLVKTLVLID
jgi:enterobactin synthetase component D